MDKEQRKGLLKSVATAIVSDMVDFNYGSSSISTSGDNNDDYIYQYAQQLVSLGCFYLEYDDAIRKVMWKGFLGVGSTCYQFL